jgi:hypothetical protein
VDIMIKVRPFPTGVCAVCFLLGLLLCLSLLAHAALPIAPAATRPGTSLVRAIAPPDFVADAGAAQWTNDRGERLPFPGDPGDSRGFVRVLSADLEDNRSHQNVLQTHPRWAPDGRIEGRYRLPYVPPNSEFAAAVGFLKGAEGTDGVTFEVMFWQGNRGESLARVQKTLEGRLRTITADLSRYSGQSGELMLRCHAGASAGRDWAVWVNPRISEKSEVPSGPAIPVVDDDRDGIHDDEEQQLLAKYRPFYRFTQGENFRPCDAIWYVRHSSLKAVADEDAANVIDRDELSADPSRLLTANKSGDDWGPSNLTSNPKRTRYCLNVGNEFRDGYEPPDGYTWDEIYQIGNHGVYGHVVPWGQYYKIGYWLFFGYSDTEGWQDIGDHEADWESIHLVVDPATGWLVKTVHCAHGKEIIFDFTVQGVSRVPLSETVLEFRGPNYDTSRFDINGNVPRACNNLVRFSRDPDTGEFTHPVVYVERNTHGSWPSEHWKYEVEVAGRDYAAPPHTGNAHIYLSKPPPNLGEVEYPLSADARIILQYNGRWGAYRGHFADRAGSDTPPGPALHWQWVWPEGSALRRTIPDEAFTDGGSSFRPR